jgi:putative tryptophan/tyrosine transport system substrate-binding protein
MQPAACSLGLQITVLDASNESEIETAFAVHAQKKIDGLIINTDPFLLGQRQQIVQLAARHNIPTVYFLREFVDAGGLMSYGPSVSNSYRQAGIYVSRILKGEEAGELPVVQPTKFDLVINLRTAKTLGLDIPTNLLVRADERLRASSRDGGDGVNRPPSTLTMLLSRHTRRREFITPKVRDDVVPEL